MNFNDLVLNGVEVSFDIFIESITVAFGLFSLLIVLLGVVLFVMFIVDLFVEFIKAKKRDIKRRNVCDNCDNKECKAFCEAYELKNKE